MHLCPHVRVPPWVQVTPRPLQQVGIPRQRVMLCRATFRHLCSAGSNKQCGAGQQRGGGVPVPGADGRRCGESGLHDGAMPRVAVPFSSCTGANVLVVWTWGSLEDLRWQGVYPPPHGHGLASASFGRGVGVGGRAIKVGV